MPLFSLVLPRSLCVLTLKTPTWPHCQPTVSLTLCACLFVCFHHSVDTLTNITCTNMAAFVNHGDLLWKLLLFWKVNGFLIFFEWLPVQFDADRYWFAHKINHTPKRLLRGVGRLRRCTALHACSKQHHRLGSAAKRSRLFCRFCCKTLAYVRMKKKRFINCI